MNNMKKILFLGGSPMILNAIRWAKDIGFAVAVADGNPEAPGLKAADIKLNCRGDDINVLLRWSLKERPMYCYSGNDFGRLPAAVIHRALCIPHVSEAVAIMDKMDCRRVWNGVINVPKYTDRSPAVVKPVGKSGSIGVSVVMDGDLIDAITEASKHGEVIIEEYIDGIHLDVNAFIDHTGFHPLGISERTFLDGIYPVAKGGVFPVSIDRTIRSKIYRQLELAARLMGITHGPAKADIVFRDGVPFFIEVSPMFHGDIVTICMMGFLEELNPVYQLMRNVYYGTSTWFSVYQLGTIGRWSLMCDSLDTDGDGYYYRGGTANPRNNSEIIGLKWWYEKNK